MVDKKCFITGIATTALQDDEVAFLKKYQPFGIILFTRNIDNPSQVQDLIAHAREISGWNMPVLIDQEGGRVQRLKPPHWKNYPPGSLYANLANKDKDIARKAIYLGAQLIGYDLKQLGIDVDCLPVLDIAFPFTHNVIGDRALGSEAVQIAELGQLQCAGLLSQGVLPVIKHIPGHGRAQLDSHLDLPVVETDQKTLREHDFQPFKALNDMPFAMTAHIIYSAFDPDHPATTSPHMLQLMRDDIGFDGAIMSDDLSMEALSGSIDARANAAYNAGCDLLLHCNGNMQEMIDVAQAAPFLEGAALQRCETALQKRNITANDFDYQEAQLEFERLTQWSFHS